METILATFVELLLGLFLEELCSFRSSSCRFSFVCSFILKKSPCCMDSRVIYEEKRLCAFALKDLRNLRHDSGVKCLIHVHNYEIRTVRHRHQMLVLA